MIKPILEILAGIPSVVLGFFALTWISPNLIQPISGAPLFNMAAAGVAVGVLIMPLIASVTEADYIALKSDELEKTRAAWAAAAGEG